MNDPGSKDADGQLQLIRGLLEDNAQIDGDVLKIDTDIWAIHGVIPYDGEVLMAEYHTYDEAKYALNELHEDPGPANDP